jgi:hypothetical protein
MDDQDRLVASDSDPRLSFEQYADQLEYRIYRYIHLKGIHDLLLSLNTLDIVA